MSNPGDVSIDQGTDPDFRIPNVRDATDTLITTWAGYSVRAQVRDRADSAAVLHEWTSEGPDANVTFEASDVVLDVRHAVTSAWTWNRARYDVELTNPDGLVARIAEGHITVSREVTR